MAFTGMVGRVLAQTMLRSRMAANAANGAVNNGGGYRGAFQSSGKYLFVAHPNCCDKCTQMNGTLWNTPDVAFISHPNCKCATIEAPAGLSPSELMDWTKSPVGVMRFGFNYGVSLKPVQLRNENRDKVFAQWHERMDPFQGALHPRRRVRAIVSQSQIDAIRARVESGELGPGKDLTRRVQGLVRATETRKAKAAMRRHVEEIRNNGANLRKGSTWIPGRVRTQSKLKNTTVIPRNNRGTTAESSPVTRTPNMRAAIRALGGFGKLAKNNQKRKEQDEIRRSASRETARRAFMKRKNRR